MRYLHQLSDLYNFVSCPHRWYLKRVLLLDADNIYTIQGTIDHSRSALRSTRKNSENEYELYDLSVGDDERLYGICDAVLCFKESGGIYIEGLSKNSADTYSICPIEYKPKRHKGLLQRATDFQCLAQAHCLSKIFGYPVKEYFVYYQQERRRVSYKINSSDYQELFDILDAMDNILGNCQIPPISFSNEFCQKCSSYPQCLPEVNEDVNLQSFIQKERS